MWIDRARLEKSNMLEARLRPATPLDPAVDDPCTINPEQMAGEPCLRSLRIPVATVVGMVTDGMPEPRILAAYPDLEAGDIRQALMFAAEAVPERELPLLTGVPAAAQPARHRG
jgi:uncharacterized protein (DUF433 family)